MCFCSIKYSENALQSIKQTNFDMAGPKPPRASVRIRTDQKTYEPWRYISDDEERHSTGIRMNYERTFKSIAPQTKDNVSYHLQHTDVISEGNNGIQEMKHHGLPTESIPSDSRNQRGSINTQRSFKRIRVPSANPNTTLLVNPDCFVKILMDYIYETLNMKQSEINLDFCDEEGKMIELFRLKPYESALTKLEIRKQYYLVQYELCDDDSYKFIEPLIKRSTKQDSEIIRKLMQRTPSKPDCWHMPRLSIKRRSRRKSISVGGRSSIISYI